ncbi:hypothetical protein N9H45_00380 [Opitutales bacterium]|nr:hypothetical protein [Opitutales bacterium]
MTGHNARRDLYGDLILTILGVKMRWSMVAIIHPDDDPEKSGNFRHGERLGAFRGSFNSFRRPYIVRYFYHVEN